MSIDGRAVRDDLGPLNALGCTLFPGAWAEKHDVPRLERAFKTLASGPYHFYRSGTGFQPVSWEDRMADPADVDTVIKMAARGFSHGLRAWHCLFMDGNEAPGAETSEQRRAIVEQWAAKLQGHERFFLCLEIANEAGSGAKMPVSEIRALGKHLQARTSVPIILTDTRSNQEWIDLYRGSGMQLATQHFERDDSGDGGRYEHLSKMAEFPVEPVDPTACMSGEPKGPGSSGQSEWNVNRLVLGYVCTLVEGCAGFVFHPGPGIRLGGAHDRHRMVDGRSIPADLADLPEFVGATKGFAVAQGYLPDGIANWRRWRGHRAHDSGLINFITYRGVYENHEPNNGIFDDSWGLNADGEWVITNPRRLFKSFVVQSPDGRSWLAPLLRVLHPFPIEIKQAAKVEAFDAVTGEVFQSETVSAGGTFQITPRAPSGATWDGDGFLLKGTLK